MPGERTRWRPGQSGNPGGKCKAAVLVARLVGEQTRDGAEIVERVLAIARSPSEGPWGARSVCWALDFLASRLWGRPSESVEITAPGPAEPPADFNALTDDELREYTRICEKAQAAAMRKLPLADLIAAGRVDDSDLTDDELWVPAKLDAQRDPLGAAQRKVRGLPLDELRRLAAGHEE